MPLHADNIRLGGNGEPISPTGRVLKPEGLNVKFLAW